VEFGGICLGYIEPDKFENMSESERNTILDECFSYSDELRKNRHLVAEEPLQPANTALTVYWKNGKVAVTDGPYAETKEQLGGILVLEARDLNHAIQLISQNPGVKLKCGLILAWRQSSMSAGWGSLTALLYAE
jgi:hypothetical protein